MAQRTDSTESERIIDLELNTDELRVLSQCRVLHALDPIAEAAIAETLNVPRGTSGWRRATRKPISRILGGALAILIALAALLPGTAERQALPHTGRSRAAVQADTGPLVTATATSAATSKPLPVRFANPFDRVEIFEFPPGTDREAARETVAQYLIDRARDRHVRPLHRARTRSVSARGLRPSPRWPMRTGESS